MRGSNIFEGILIRKKNLSSMFKVECKVHTLVNFTKNLPLHNLSPLPTLGSFFAFLEEEKHIKIIDIIYKNDL